jgi:hypothetical protein
MAKVGRPSKYTDELAEVICTRIADGESLRRICRDADMPDKETIRRWRGENEAFRARYARAREDAADSYADRMLAYCDDFETADSITRVQGLKEASQNLRWLAGVTKPKVYGDLQKLEHSGAGGAPLKITIERPGGEGDD